VTFHKTRQYANWKTKNKIRKRWFRTPYFGENYKDKYNGDLSLEKKEPIIIHTLKTLNDSYKYSFIQYSIIFLQEKNVLFIGNVVWPNVTNKWVKSNVYTFLIIV